MSQQKKRVCGPSTNFLPYQPAETAASILMQAHCTVIDELLDAVLAVFAEDGAMYFGEDQYSKARVRLNVAAASYHFVARAVR